MTALAAAVAALALGLGILGVSYQSRGGLVSRLETLSRTQVAEITQNHQAIAAADRTIEDLRGEITVAVDTLEAHNLSLPVPVTLAQGSAGSTAPGRDSVGSPDSSTTTTTTRLPAGSPPTTTSTTMGCFGIPTVVCVGPTASPAPSSPVSATPAGRKGAK